MTEQAQSQPSAKTGRAPKLALAFLCAAIGLVSTGTLLHEGGGAILIESGYPKTGLKVIDIFGSDKTTLNAQLFAQIYAGNAELSKALLDRGAKFDWTGAGSVIDHGREDLFRLLVENDPAQARDYAVSVASSKYGTAGMLQTLKEHGLPVGGRALDEAASVRPDLVPWILANGSCTAEEVMNAEISAVWKGNLAAFGQLRAVAEPDARTRVEIIKMATGQPPVLSEVMGIMTFSADEKRAGLAEALEADREESFHILAAQLPPAAVREVVGAAVAGQDRKTQFLIGEAQQGRAPPPHLDPAPR